MFYYPTKEDKDKNLSLYLYDQGISRAMLRHIKMKGDLLINGQHQTVRYSLTGDETIEVIFPLEVSQIPPDKIDLNIRYEDEHYIILDKDPQIACIPTKTHPRHTIANALIYYYQHNHIQATVHLVNRLDKETQGLMLIAKDAFAHHLLSSDIKQVHRRYHCLVDGVLEGQGTINQPIAKEGMGTKRMISTSGKPSITHYRVLETYEDQTLVECTLVTGRTHQIRLHMASIGHPLSGDCLYGSLSDQVIYLDSVELEFIHPFTHHKVIIKK